MRPLRQILQIWKTKTKYVEKGFHKNYSKINQYKNFEPSE